MVLYFLIFSELVCRLLHALSRLLPICHSGFCFCGRQFSVIGDGSIADGLLEFDSEILERLPL